MIKSLLYGALLSLVFSSAYAVEEIDPLLDNAVSTANEVRGVLRSQSQAVLSSELAGRVTEMPYREGQAFKKGAL